MKIIHSNFGFDPLLKIFENHNYVWNCFCHFSFGFIFDNFGEKTPRATILFMWK